MLGLRKTALLCARESLRLNWLVGLVCLHFGQSFVLVAREVMIVVFLIR